MVNTYVWYMQVYILLLDARDAPFLKHLSSPMNVHCFVLSNRIWEDQQSVWLESVHPDYCGGSASDT